MKSNIKQNDTVSTTAAASLQPCGGEGLFELQTKEPQSSSSSNPTKRITQPSESLYGDMIFISKPDRQPYYWNNPDPFKYSQSKKDSRLALKKKGANRKLPLVRTG